MWPFRTQERLPTAPTFALIVTRGHRHDALVLREWIHRPFVFLGMIGSRRKWRLIHSQFREEDIASDEALTRVACPVGVPIGARSVHEIAVSILAEVLMLKDKGTGKPMKAKQAEAGSESKVNEK